MPPKRRKLSLDDVGRDIERLDTDNEAENDPATKRSVCVSDNTFEGMEIDIKRSKTKSNTDLSTDTKTKEDSLKPTRISERLIIKRNRLGDAEEAENQTQAPAQTQAASRNQNQVTALGQNQLSKSQNQTTPRKPKTAQQTGKQHRTRKKNKRRPCTQWSIRDKKLFFMGIGMFGKNFEAISNKISFAAKLRGLPLKDKTQVRYFYYRCWAKISKYIHLNHKDMKMKNAELYGLINYGVLEQHVKETDPQFERCLNELILYGETTYVAKNVRGKKARVAKLRTPICTYLKKINRIEDRQAEVAASQKIPHHITLELTPKNSKAWAKVQDMSQNPRVRFKLTPNQTLESVFKFLSKKWKTHRVRLKESLGVKEESEEELICYLHPLCKITPVKLIPQEQQKIDVTFTSYRENILPTLQKSKKVKAKESEKCTEDKEKPKNDSLEDQAAVGKMTPDSSEICSGSKTKASADVVTGEKLNLVSTTEPPSAFANLLTAAVSSLAAFGQSDAVIVDQTTEQLAPADTPAGPKTPVVLLDDENAMFPDSSPFSPPCSFIETSRTSVIPPSSPSSESSLPSSVISSPTLVRKKCLKPTKKTVLEEGVLALDICDKNDAVSASDNSSSPSKAGDPMSPNHELKEVLDTVIARVANLATEGFTLQTSNTVTILHLSLILGRENVIRLEYEWKEKKPHKVQLPPLLCQAANQMSNVLRRLCNLATLELTDFNTFEKAVDPNKHSNKSVPCSHCGREGTGKSRSKKHANSDRKEGTKEVATMTDPLKVDPPPLTQVFQPSSGMTISGRTFVAGPTSQATVQITGPDPVFRVPFAPTVKSVSLKDEQMRLEEQRLQMQANAIMQQGLNNNRLLKKRTLNPRNRKTPSIIVQRTLLPKVDTGQVVAYIQQSVPQPLARPLVVDVAADNLVKLSQPLVNIVTSSGQSVAVSQDQILNNIGPLNDVFVLSAQNAEISSNSVIVSEKNDQSPGFSMTGAVDNLHQESFFPMSVVSTSTSSSLGTVQTEMAGPVLNAQGDISISDLDISMSSVAGSNLGPDAGDKFLDMVLQNPEQGFSGLISTPKKLVKVTESYQPVLTDNASFDSSVLRTPPHSGIPAYINSSSIFPSPIKLNMSNQPWISTDCGDISLSSVLGDSSPFKTNGNDTASERAPSPSAPPSYAIFFETGSSDIPETGSIVFSKSSAVSDISLSSFLGDTSLKKVDCDGVSSSDSALSNAVSESQTGMGFFSDAVGPPQLFNEVSQDSFARIEVDRALQGIVSDSSMDLVSKFEFLAAHITGHQDRELAGATDKQGQLLGGSVHVENVAKFESRSTAS